MAEKSEVAPEANRLYWETEASVAEIGEKLGLSRRALYEAIEPLPTGADCASCGAELYYNNRSAKTSAVGRCLVCGEEREIDGEVSREDVGMLRDDSDVSQRTRNIAVYAIAGLLVGAVATLLIRQRR